MEATWASEHLYFDGDEYYSAVFDAIDSAKHEVIVECYILANDHVGKQLVKTLEKAIKRGVKVRLLVDGLGSYGWLRDLKPNSPLAECTRVFHPLRFRFFTARFWHRINRRLHRKQIIIDTRQAFVGSMNFCNVHSHRAMKDCAWQDASAQVSGEDVLVLKEIFEKAWRRASPRKPLKRFTAPQFLLSQFTFSPSLQSQLVRANESTRSRRHFQKDILKRIKNAKSRIWIANPYFVPERRWLAALRRKNRKMKEIKVIVPEMSDVFIVRLATLALYRSLIKRGVQIFEFQPRFFHGKIMITDDWMILGSSNLNHRSFLHDLELDVVLTKKTSKSALVHEWHSWLKNAKPVDAKRLQDLGFFNLWLGRFILLFRWWL